MENKYTRIYAYTTDKVLEVPWKHRSINGKGLIKIGQTSDITSDERIKRQFQGDVLTLMHNSYTKLLDVEALDAEFNYFSDKERFDSLADKVIYTGPIDEFFNYKYGKLDWRTVYWKNEEKNTDNYQGCAVMNYTGNDIEKEPWTRIIEHKHFYKDQSNFPVDKTVISYESSEEYKDGKEKLLKLYEERYDLYRLYADKILVNDTDWEDVLCKFRKVIND